MRFLAYLSVLSLGLLSVAASPALQARQDSTSTDPSAVMSQLKTNADPIVAKLQSQFKSGNATDKDVASELDQLKLYINQAESQLSAAPASGSTSSNEKRQLPDPLAPASSGLDLASSIVGLVDSIIGLANNTSSDGDDTTDPLEGLGLDDF